MENRLVDGTIERAKKSTFLVELSSTATRGLHPNKSLSHSKISIVEDTIDNHGYIASLTTFSLPEGSLLFVEGSSFMCCVLFG